MTTELKSNGTRAVHWQHIPPDGVETPVTRTVPYLELKLEHSSLDPTGYNSKFFPDAVPYELDGTARVFYWRPSLYGDAPPSEDWHLTCATTHGFSAYSEFPTEVPPLTTEGQDDATIIVDGTVAGEAATAHLASYRQPEIRVDGLWDDTVSLTIEGENYAFDPGERQRIHLTERRIEPPDEGAMTMTVTPELLVRYPGRRKLHHPAPGTTDWVFPSFGLSLASVPNPVSVPITAGELNHTALAEELGIDLSERPYAERILWQAFAYSAFDPHQKRVPQITQLSTDKIILENTVSGGGSL